jgi:lysophospholipase L1-like esterase
VASFTPDTFADGVTGNTPITAVKLNNAEQQYADAMADAAALYGHDVRAWAPFTAYALGQAVVNPSGDLVTAVTPHTSGASYTPGNWAHSALAPLEATPGILAHYRAAVARVRNGTGNARILCVGDSTTAGYGDSTAATIPATNSYPARLGALLNSYVAPAATGLGVPHSVAGTGVDQRWTYGTGWADNGVWGWANSCSIHASSPAGSLVYTAGVNADRYDVYYIQATGLGSLTITATGGTPVAQPTAGTSSVQKVTVAAAAASTSNTVTFAATGSVYVLGVEPYLSTKSQVLVGNAGAAGCRSVDWNSGNGPGFDSLSCITAYAPDLTIISLGINDAGASIAPATFSTNLQALITAAQASGDVLLMTFPPSSGSPYATVEPTYIPVYKTLAPNSGCALIDLNGRWVSWASANSLGMVYDTIHPNDIGYWDVADLVFTRLQTV